MSEPATILESIEARLRRGMELAGVRVMVTAGPTYEAIDPVRYIANRSSGKMGYAVAEEARDRGAVVSLVSGPTALPAPHDIDVVNVESFAEMRRAVLNRAPGQDVIVMAAAVADFRPAHRSEQKVKRQDGLTLELIANGDLAAELSSAAPRAVHVGFALETEDLVERAREKLERKGQDLVVANELSSRHNPFGSDTNQVVMITRDGSEVVQESSKRNVAMALWDRVAALLAQR